MGVVVINESTNIPCTCLVKKKVFMFLLGLSLSHTQNWWTYRKSHFRYTGHNLIQAGMQLLIRPYFSFVKVTSFEMCEAIPGGSACPECNGQALPRDTPHLDEMYACTSTTTTHEKSTYKKGWCHFGLQAIFANPMRYYFPKSNYTGKSFWYFLLTYVIIFCTSGKRFWTISSHFDVKD